MQGLLVVLPVAVLIALARVGRADMGWRDRFMLAAVVWGAALAAMTEVLSGFGALTAPGVAGGWLIVMGGVLAARATRWEGMPPRAPGPLAARRDPWCMAALGAVGILVGATGAVAIMAAPQTWDSMTYHLSRVAHWIQNASVVHYPTAIDRQLYQSPWAEFAILHLQLLSGGDRFANLVQWSAFLGSLVGVSLVTAQLGGGPRQQLVAVAVVASVPMVIVQASSTQNDLVLAFWLVCLVHWAEVWSRSAEVSHRHLPALAMGAALGLAVLTKATAYVFAPPVVAWAVIRRWRATRRVPWRSLVVVMLVAEALNLAHHERNLWWYGSPLGPGAEGAYGYTNSAAGMRQLGSLVVRNLGLHAGTLSVELNAGLERAVGRLHAALGVGVNDSPTTWPGTTFRIERPRYHEDLAGNGLHLLLILTVLAILVVSGRARRAGSLSYAAMLIVAFLFFCIVLRWQPWHSRLQLPLFVLASPLVALTVTGWRRFGVCTGVALCLAAWPWILFNESRPLLGDTSILGTARERQYFRNRDVLRDPYTRAANFIGQRGCGEVGVVLGADDWEYPLWILLRRAVPPPRPLYIEHALVRGEPGSDPSPRHRGPPCALVVTRFLAGELIAYRGQRYDPGWAAPGISVFVPAAQVAGGQGASDSLRPVADHKAGMIQLSVEPSRLTPGMTVTIGVVAQAPPTGADLELVVGVLYPDSRSIMVLTGEGGMRGPYAAVPWIVLPATRVLRAGDRLSVPQVARIAVPAGTPPGSYEIVAFLIARVEDGRPGRRVAADRRLVTLVAPSQ